MNILTDRLPESVVIEGKRYKINSDFRTAIKILSFAEETGGVKLLIYALKSFYCEVPENIRSAIEEMKSFYHAANKERGGGEGLFSFERDAELIFSAFMSQYGINLAEDNFHWYVFLALLRGLCGENAFTNAVRVRALDLSDVKDAKRKAYLTELKQKYSLSGSLTIDEGLRRVF